MLPNYEDNIFSHSSCWKQRVQQTPWCPSISPNIGFSTYNNHHHKQNQANIDSKKSKRKEAKAKKREKHSTQHHYNEKSARVQNQAQLEPESQTSEIKHFLDKLREIVPQVPKQGKLPRLELIQYAIDHICELQHSLDNHPRLKGLDPRVLAAPGQPFSPCEMQEILLQQEAERTNEIHHPEAEDQSANCPRYQSSTASETNHLTGEQQQRLRKFMNKTGETIRKPRSHREVTRQKNNAVRLPNFSKETSTNQVNQGRSSQVSDIMGHSLQQTSNFQERFEGSHLNPQAEYIQQDHFQRPPQKDIKDSPSNGQTRPQSQLPFGTPQHGSTPYPRRPGNSRPVLQVSSLFITYVMYK